jgi:hypothetical protein
MNPHPRQLTHISKGSIVCRIVVDKVGEVVEEVEDLDEAEQEADVGDAEGGADCGFDLVAEFVRG